MEILDEGLQSVSPENEIEIGRLRHDAEMGIGHIRNARIALFVLSGLALVGTVINAARQQDVEVWLSVTEGVIIAGIHFAIALTIFKRPKMASMAGLLFYAFLILVNFITTPATIFTGLILKIIIVYYLIKGVQGATSFEQANSELAAYGEEITIS